MAGHEFARAAGLYDWRNNSAELGDVERVGRRAACGFRVEDTSCRTIRSETAMSVPSISLPKPVVFISYAHSTDHQLDVMNLADRLRDSGLDVRFDGYEEAPVEGWARWASRQILEAHFILVVCDASYHRRALRLEDRPGGGAEWELALIYQELYDAGGNNHRIIPLLFGDSALAHIPPPLKGSTFYRPDIEEDYERLLARLFGRRITPLRAAVTNDKRCSIQMVPRRNNWFTGREDVLRQIRKAFTRGGRTGRLQALTGLGGVGKTQIAIEYAHRFASSYRGIFWIDSATNEGIASRVLEIAFALDLVSPGNHDSPGSLQLFLKWLAANSRWLLIFDGVELLGVIKSYLPGHINGHILITSRIHSFQEIRIASPIRVTPFDERESTEFLLHYGALGTSDPELIETARQLWLHIGGLPLALEQAGAYIAAHQITLFDYVAAFQKRGLEMLERSVAPASDYPSSVVEMWESNLSQVRAAPGSADVLSISAFFAPDNIPIRFIGTERFDIDRLLEPLLRYSLLCLSPDCKTYSMHTLVQAVVQNSMNSDERRKWAERAVDALSQTFPSSDYDFWSECESLFPHGLRSIEHIEDLELKTPSACRLLNRLGSYMGARGLAQDGEYLCRMALRIGEAVLDSHDPYLSSILNNLSVLLIENDNLPEAEALLRRNIAMTEVDGRLDHYEAGISLTNLGNVLSKAGTLEEAICRLKQALVIFGRTREADHPIFANVFILIAYCLELQGQSQEAETLYKRGLDICENLSAVHPRLGTALNNLASFLTRQGRFAEAEPLYRRALEIMEMCFGRNHPRIAIVCDQFADLLHMIRGRDAEGQALRLRSQAIRRDKPPGSHLLRRSIIKNVLLIERS